MCGPFIHVVVRTTGEMPFGFNGSEQVAALEGRLHLYKKRGGIVNGIVPEGRP